MNCTRLLMLAGACASISVPATAQVRELPPAPWCGMALSPADAAMAIQLERSGVYAIPGGVDIPQPVYVGLAVHVVRTSQGQGGLVEQRLDHAIALANAAFAPIGIQFCKYGDTRYINNDFFYHAVDGAIDQLRMTDVVPGVINLYFVGSMDITGVGALCGISSFTFSAVQGVVISNDCSGGSGMHSTLAHELGHYFNLFHTHETAMGVECTDGSNCTVAGDLLCDTPADPGLLGLVSSSCVYGGSASPACGSPPYNPPVHNMMSYSLAKCRDRFTTQQQARALTTLALRHELIHNPCNAPTNDYSVVHTFNWTSCVANPQLTDVTFKYHCKTRTRSRHCKDKEKIRDSDTYGVVVFADSRSAASLAPDSDATASALAEISSVVPGTNSTTITGDTEVRGTAVPLRSGCSGKWRKTAFAKSKAKAKLTLHGKDARCGAFRWLGRWKNLSTSHDKASHRLFRDPVIATLYDRTTSTQTSYTLLSVDCIVGPGSGAVSWQNGTFTSSAPEMTFHAVVGPAGIVAQPGELLITVDNGVVTGLIATGPFATIVGLPVLNGPGTAINFPLVMDVNYDLQGNPAHDLDAELDMDGGAHDTAIPTDEVSEVCTPETGLFNGADEADTSSPRNGDTALGYNGNAPLFHLAQKVTVPSGSFSSYFPSTLMIYGYQTGAAVGATTVTSATVRIWSGIPGAGGSVLWSDGLNRLDDVEADTDINRTAPNNLLDATRPLQELWIDLEGAPPLAPGDYWVEVALQGDANLPGPWVLPCPWPSPSGVGARVFDVGANQWQQIQDPGSGNPVELCAVLFVDDEPTTPRCYANCDNSTTPPILNVNDFQCFLNKYAAGDPYANCDSSTTPPILNVNDFQCFLNRYATGCP